MSPDWADKPEPVPYADLSDPQSLNLYSYVRNNPMSHADADGHETSTLDFAIQEIEREFSHYFPIAAAAGSNALRTTLGVVGVVLTPTSGGSTHELQMEQQMKTAAGGNRGKSGGDNNKQTATSPGPDGMAPKKGSSGGPGEGKDFSDKTKAQGLQENKDANGGTAKCVFCGTEPTNASGPDQLNFDHATSKAAGGNNELDNLNVTCRYCNQSKGTGPEPKTPKPQ